MQKALGIHGGSRCSRTHMNTELRRQLNPWGEGRLATGSDPSKHSAIHDCHMRENTFQTWLEGPMYMQFILVSCRWWILENLQDCDKKSKSHNHLSGKGTEWGEEFEQEVDLRMMHEMLHVYMLGLNRGKGKKEGVCPSEERRVKEVEWTKRAIVQ